MNRLIKVISATAVILSLQAPLAMIGAASASAQSEAPANEMPQPSQAATSKINAYVEFLNRSLRASESLQRYDSWVDMKKGPTGKERIIYGLYSLYDVRKEADAVTAAAAAEPQMPELDSAMLAYLETYQKLAPVIDRADKYYEREDYKSDKMEAGKAFHKDIAALAPDYWERRKAADAALRKEKVKLDLETLAALEKEQGRKARWQVRNVMFRAEAIMDLMPSNEKPVVDMPAYKQALDDYASAVREFDDYALAHPDSFHVFEDQPGSLLSKLRNFGEKLQKTKGDARKGRAGDDLEWLVTDYNMMVSTSQTATTFSKE